MGCKIRSKSRKSVPGGIPKWRQEAKMIKRGGYFNSAALFLTIFVENGLQDGGQNQEQINRKVIQNLLIFSCFTKHDFGRIFNEKSLENRSKNDAKINPNIIIKQTVEMLKFCFPSRREAQKRGSSNSQIHQKIMKNQCKKLEVFQIALGIDFLLIFGGFLLQVEGRNRVKIERKWC